MKKVVLVCFLLIVVCVGGMMVYGHLNPEKAYRLSQNLERGGARLAEKTVNVNDLEIHYLDSINGEPLVLIHGFGANKDNWTRVSRYLTGQYRVVAPDLPGFGESTKNRDLDYSLRAQAERVHAFLKALGFSKVHMGGSSMGGAIAGVYASLYPDEVKSLWLVSPGDVNAPEPSELQTLLEAGKKTPLIAETPEEFKTTLEFVFNDKPFIPPAIVKLLAEQTIANKPIKDVVFKALISEPVTIDVLLKDSPIPTLVLWGDKDRVLHASGAGVLCSSLARASCVIMKDAGHLPMIERPKEAAEAFLAFQNGP